MRLALQLIVLLLVVFVLPALASAAWWAVRDHPASWRDADWSSSGLLPDSHRDSEAAVYVLAARTGGFKGAFAVHSWIVTKASGASSYARYDKVGWGMPVRRNAYAADARWYSNEPVIIRKVSGAAAEALIPQVEAAVAAYPYAKSGDYHIWPGPNSNSFVAYVIDAVPALGARMPPNATGRDFAPGVVSAVWSSKTWDLHATVGGYAGISIGATSGFEVHFLGLVAGFDLTRPALKIPAFGTVPLWSDAPAV